MPYFIKYLKNQSNCVPVHRNGNKTVCVEASKPNIFYANDSSIFISNRHMIANSIMYMAYFMCFKLVYGYEWIKSENSCIDKSMIEFSCMDSSRIDSLRMDIFYY